MMCRLIIFYELHVFLSLRSCHCNDGHFCLVVKPCAMIFISLIVCETMMCHLFSFSKLHVVQSFKLSTLISVQILIYSQAVLCYFGFSFWLWLCGPSKSYRSNDLRLLICSLPNLLPSHHFLWALCCPVPQNLPLNWLFNVFWTIYSFFCLGQLGMSCFEFAVHLSLLFWVMLKNVVFP